MLVVRVIVWVKIALAMWLFSKEIDFLLSSGVLPSSFLSVAVW